MSNPSNLMCKYILVKAKLNAHWNGYCIWPLSFATISWPMPVVIQPLRAHKHILLNEQCHFSPHLGQNINACAYPSQVPWNPLFVTLLKTADYSAWDMKFSLWCILTFRRQIYMPTVSFDGLSLSALAQTFKLQPSKHKQTNIQHARTFTSTL